jgi:cation diffusion facilitator CzcD-associated flavoprotein CzcO
MEGSGRQKVAVIGTGMAGLVIAYILRNDPQGRFEVEVFEKVSTASHFCSNASKAAIS